MQRQDRHSIPAVDYLVIRDGLIIPVKIKSGTRGAMQSLMRFMKEKRASYGIRLSLENFASYGPLRACPVYAAADVVHATN